MVFYYYVYLSILVIIIFIVIIFLKSIWKNANDLLFIEGVKQENLGHFEDAVIIYEKILSEISKLKFQNKFKHKIAGKIKVLHTMMEYESMFRNRNLSDKL